MLRLHFLSRIAVTGVLAACGMSCCTQSFAASPRTFLVDCNTASGTGAGFANLRSIEQVNALTLGEGDRVLFRRGTVCHGSLQPKGLGFTLGAAGSGPLPQIIAGAEDEAALSLFNSDHIHIDSLALRGGTTFGIHISGDRPVMHEIALHNLTVSEVIGKLRKKGSGLVVIAPSNDHAGFTDVDVDGVRAFNTTQWSGIFIDRASHAAVRNSVVHDVEGDGIVVFDSTDSRIEHSVAWHTGLQAKESIGTPNAIWTWRCERCTVEDNEAFLTDSPGIDGGAFDIDWGNTLNSVTHNFGHDTVGYCVSVFAAYGPTVHSKVDGNLCLNNGRSPRLARRQGAILVLTWNGGSVDDVVIAHNRIDWRPGGDAAAVQTGAGVAATHVLIEANEIHSTSTQFVSPLLRYDGKGNSFMQEGGAHGSGPLRFAETRAEGWQLRVGLPRQNTAGTARLETLMVRLVTALAEYPTGTLMLNLAGAPDSLQLFQDSGLAGVEGAVAGPGNGNVLELVSPQGRVAASWQTTPDAIEFGLTLRSVLGEPEYGTLAFQPLVEPN